MDIIAGKANVIIELDSGFDRTPSDSEASINTQGLLGGKFIRLESGVSSEYLHESRRILSTHSATTVDMLIRKITNGDTDRTARSKNSAQPQQP